MTWSALFEAQLAADPGRPLVTYYDDATGERVELSVATYANWVAKTANLLVDGLRTVPGDVVAVHGLPRHWQPAVWAGAVWAAGLVLSLAAGPDEAAVAVVGPDVATGAAPPPTAGEVVGLSLLPLGAPFAAHLAGGVLDYAREVAGYGDRFATRAVPGPAPALVDAAGVALTHLELADRGRVLAQRWGLGAGGRLLVAEPLDPLDELLAGTLVPLLVGGSVVLVRHPDVTALPARGEQERVTARVSRGRSPSAW